MTKKPKSNEASGWVPHLDDSRDLLVKTTKEAIERLCNRESPDFDEGFYEWLKNRKFKRGRKGPTLAELEAIGITYWAYTRLEGMTSDKAKSRLYNHYEIEEIEKILTKANKLEKVQRLYKAKVSNPK
jgi:hypothetical protein